MQPRASVEIFPGEINVDILLILFSLLTIHAHGRSENALPFLHYKQNAVCYDNSHNNGTPLAQQCFPLTLVFAQ